MQAVNIIEHDSHWDQTLKFASLTDSPQTIRQLIAIILVFFVIHPIQWNFGYLRIIMRNFSDTNSDKCTHQEFFCMEWSCNTPKQLYDT